MKLLHCSCQPGREVWSGPARRPVDGRGPGLPAVPRHRPAPEKGEAGHLLAADGNHEGVHQGSGSLGCHSLRWQPSVCHTAMLTPRGVFQWSERSRQTREAAWPTRHWKICCVWNWTLMRSVTNWTPAKNSFSQQRERLGNMLISRKSVQKWKSGLLICLYAVCCYKMYVNMLNILINLLKC